MASRAIRRLSVNTALKCDQSYEASSAVLSHGTTCFSAFLEILVNLTWPLLKLVEGLTFAKENQAADFEGKGTDMYEHLQETRVST